MKDLRKILATATIGLGFIVVYAWALDLAARM